jgi:polyphenol oxidase
MASMGMDPATWLTFPALESLPGFRHRFTLRHPQIDVNEERAVVVERLWSWHSDHAKEMGFIHGDVQKAEQVHGIQVTVIDQARDFTSLPAPETDGLITQTPGIVLGIYVADCCAVYLADPITGSFGVLHSGKKGSEGGITSHAISLMQSRFGANPADLVVQLSPCIRPPAYEIDFAALIRTQALDAGVQLKNLHDTGICTSADPNRFYSYRREKGRTGRMLALMGRIV